MGQARLVSRRRVYRQIGALSFLVGLVSLLSAWVLAPLLSDPSPERRAAAADPTLAGGGSLAGPFAPAEAPLPGRADGEAEDPDLDLELEAGSGPEALDELLDEDPPWAEEALRPGTRVRVWRRGLEGGRPLAQGQVDPSGRLVLSPAVAGPLTVLVEGDGPPRAGGGLGRLAPLERLEGTVLGPLDEGVQAEVTVWLGALPLARTRADLSGWFQLEWSPVPGAIVEAVAPGTVPARAALPARGELMLRLRSGPTGVVQGEVLGAEGAPLEDAVVRVLRGESAVVVAVCDGAGRFRTPALEPGLVALEVHRGGEVLPVALGEARVPAGGVASVRLRAAGTASLAVRIQGAAGPEAGWRVRIVEPGVSRFGGAAQRLDRAEAVTDAAGWAELSGLLPGRVYVRADAPQGGAPLLAEAELAPGQRLELPLVVSTRSLSVRVVDAGGAPVEGVYMDVSMPGIDWEGMPSTRSGADGVGRFERLPAGLAEVHLGKDGLWRMVRSNGEEATFVWSGEGPLRLEGRVQGYVGPALAVVVLEDVAWTAPLQIGSDGQLLAALTPPAGPCRVWLVARERALAPLDVGAPDAAGAVRVEGRFAPGATARGRLVAAGSGAGLPGRVRPAGSLAAALEARAQWLGGTDEDPWITINEWARATGPEGGFELPGLPAGPLTLELSGVGAGSATLGLEPELAQGEERALGDLPLGPP